MQATGTLVAALLASIGLVAVATAPAKNFGPGDLRLCGASRCVAVTDRGLRRSFGRFIYDEGSPPLADTPRLGAPVYQLRFRNGYVAGLVGTSRLDRFRSHGVICGRFRRGSWYRLPARIASDSRRLTAQLEPLRLRSWVPRSC